MRLALILLLGITTFAAGVVLDRAGGDRQASREALTNAQAELKQARQLAEEQQKKLEAIPAQIKEAAMAVEAQQLALATTKEAEHKKALDAGEKKRADAENLLTYARSQIGSLGAELKQTVSERNEWSAYARELEGRLEKANIAFQNAAQQATLANLAAQRAALENQAAQQRALALQQQQQRQARSDEESQGPSIEQQQRDLNEADLRMKKYLQQQDWNNTKRALNQSLNQGR